MLCVQSYICRQDLIETGGNMRIKQGIYFKVILPTGGSHTKTILLSHGILKRSEAIN